MFRLMIERGILTVMSNHTYLWNNTIKLQKNGGPIGDKLSQAAARLFLIWWDREFLLLVKSAGINITVYKRFVDDANGKAVAIDQGVIWCPEQRKLVKTAMNQSHDPPDDPADARTASVLRDIANSVTAMLSWTIDYPSANRDGKLPVLDICCWCQETSSGTITNYEFYSKPMANPVSVPENAALSVNTKFNTYRHEVFRVLSNTALHLPWHVKTKHLTKLSWKMKVSGYNEGFRVKVFNGGIRMYLRCLERMQTQGTPLHRSKDIPRRPKKTSANWFKGNDNRFSSVLYVPSTPHSALAKMLQCQEQRNRQGRQTRIKIVEVPGRTVRDTLARNYPWVNKSCGSQECFPCLTDEHHRLSCRKPGIGYTIICTKCKDDGVKAIYHGESSRCGFVRGKEHIGEFESNIKSNCMVTHNMVHHNSSKEFHFVMKIEKFFKKPLQRQIDESLRIKYSKDDGVLLMNSGSEWRSDAIPRAAFTAPGLSKKKPVGPPLSNRILAVPPQSSAVIKMTVGSPIEEILDL